METAVAAAATAMTAVAAAAGSDCRKEEGTDPLQDKCQPSPHSRENEVHRCMLSLIKCCLFQKRTVISKKKKLQRCLNKRKPLYYLVTNNTYVYLIIPCTKTVYLNKKQFQI